MKTVVGLKVSASLRAANVWWTKNLNNTCHYIGSTVSMLYCQHAVICYSSERDLRRAANGISSCSTAGLSILPRRCKATPNALQKCIDGHPRQKPTTADQGLETF